MKLTFEQVFAQLFRKHEVKCFHKVGNPSHVCDSPLNSHVFDSVQNGKIYYYYAGVYHGIDEKDYKNQFTGECEIVTQSPKLLEVGRKVKIFDWYIKQFIEEYGQDSFDSQIKKQENNTGIYNINYINEGEFNYLFTGWTCSIPIQAVYPVYEEEQKYKILLNVNGILMTNDYKVTKEQFNKIKEILDENKNS